MLDAIYAILTLLAACDVGILLVVTRRINSAEQRRTPSSSRKLCVIVPVWREESSVVDTVRFLTATVHGLADKVVIVGIGAERDEAGANPTLVLARAAAPTGPNFAVVECPGNVPNKGRQVNYAINHAIKDLDNTWALILDVDTRFNRKAIGTLLAAIEEGHTIIQQHSHFFLGFDHGTFLARMVACYQSRWTLVHELGRIWLFNRARLAMYHLVGHGLCVNCSAFFELGGFSETAPIEDVDFGYACAVAGKDVYSSPHLEASDCPTTIQQWWWQQYGWSRGVLDAPLHHSKLAGREVPLPPSTQLQRAQGFWNYIRWVGHSATIWFVILSFPFSNIALPSIFVLTYASSFIISAHFLERRQVYTSSTTRFVILGLLYTLFRSAPAVQGFVDTLFHIQRPKYKSTHTTYG